MTTTIEAVLKALDEWSHPVSRVRVMLDADGEVARVEVDVVNEEAEENTECITLI